MLDALVKNDQLMVTAVAMALFMIGYCTTTSFGVYYFKYAYKNEGTYMVFAAVLGVNSFNFYLLYIYGNPSLSYIFLNVLTLFLIGAAFIAVGVFISSLTESQLNAAIGSMGLIVVILLLGVLVNSIPVEWVRNIIRWFSFIDRYATMSSGILDLSAVVYFISFTAVFLFLTVRVYEKRRWS
jgi:ABC-2 type transport system permease protein